MSVLNPWAIWLALAGVPLLIAFLIRRWRRQRRVPSVVIYRRLLAQTATRRRFARPHHLLALLLTMLALAGLVTAAMQPVGTDVKPRNYIIILDTSASMSARELGMESTRLTRAGMALAEFVDELNVLDEVALITVGPEATLEVGWTREHDEVLTTLTHRTGVGAGTGLADAFRIADAMCQAPDETEIVLVSDGSSVAVPQHECPLRYVRIGEEADNVAVTGLTVREADALGLNEIYLAVHNASAGAREVTIHLELDGNLIDVQTHTIEPNVTVERLLRLPLPDGEHLVARASVEGENALVEDDVAYAVLRPGSRVQALLLTEHPTTFLAEALRLHPRVDLTVQAPADTTALDGPFDLLVIDAVYHGGLPHAEHMVILDAGADLLGLSTSGVVSEPEIIRWSFEHPLFRFVNLDGVHIAGATATRLPTGATSLMDMPDGPLVFELDDHGRKLLYFTFHPDRSDLPLRVAFVNMVANLVEWAQPPGAEELRANIGTGERLSAVVPGLTLVPVVGGRSGSRGIDSRDPVPAPGVYAATTSEGTRRGYVAANLFSTSEAVLAPGHRLGAGAANGWPHVERADVFPWWLLALAALALLALEWLLPGLIGFEYGRRKRKAERAEASGLEARGDTKSSQALAATATAGSGGSVR